MENTKKSGNQIIGAPSRITKERVEIAVDALLKWVKSKPENQKPQLLEHDELLYMVVSLKTISDKGRTNPSKIRVPNPVFPLDGSQEICLIINDKDNGVRSDIAKAKVKEEGLPVAKVLKYSKLKTDYKAFEAKRKLCGSYDMFVADSTVVPLLPKYLGKTFFKKKKHPIPVDLRRRQWRKQFEVACGSAFVYLGKGSCSVVKVGRVSQTKEEIVENVVAVIGGLGDVVPKKWENVRSLHLKALDSVALPLYQAVPEKPFRIEGGLGLKVEEEEEKEEVARGEEKEKEKEDENVFKRGRIHNVRYMDSMWGGLSNDVDEDQNEIGLPSGDKDQKEVGVCVQDYTGMKATEILSGDDESAGRVLKSGKKSRSVKKVVAAKKEDLCLEGNDVGNVNDAEVCGGSTPGSGMTRGDSVDIENGAGAEGVKVSTKKEKTKQVEDCSMADCCEGSVKKGKNKRSKDGAVNDSVKASSKKGKTRHSEDVAVTNSVKDSGKKGKTRHSEDVAVTNRVKDSGKKGKTKVLKKQALVT